jgi:hypothetical protein
LASTELKSDLEGNGRGLIEVYYPRGTEKKEKPVNILLTLSLPSLTQLKSLHILSLI